MADQTTSAAASGGGEAASAGLSGLQKAFLGVTSVAFAGGMAVRAMNPAEAEAGGSSTPPGAMGLTATDSTAPAADGAQGLEQYLPYVTEAALFGFLGFALGYTSRKIFKVALILIAVGFVVVQVGVVQGWFTVDWNAVLAGVNDWILNLKAEAPLTEILTDRIPSAGALLLGWLVGFKKG